MTWRPSPNSKPGWQVVSKASDSKVESTGTIVKATFFVVAAARFFLLSDLLGCVK